MELVKIKRTQKFNSGGQPFQALGLEIVGAPIVETAMKPPAVVVHVDKLADC